MLIIILLALLATNSFCQDSSFSNNYLTDLFNGFPIKMDLDSTEVKFLSQSDYEKSKNIYDSTKTDYRRSINGTLPIKLQPESAQIEYFYAYEWCGGPKHSRITALTLNYGTDEENNCEKQLKTIVKELKQLTEKTEKYKTYADAGKVGYGYQFFKNKNDKFPILTIDFTDKSCTGTENYMFIAYIRKIDE
ncbi:MAG: hypothetical protein WD048_08940 [Chitinophagales bacterium]